MTDNKPLVKVPPHSADNERHVLGSIMIDKDAVEKVIDILVPEDFFDDRHGSIFKIVQGLFMKSQPCDVTSVCSELHRMNKLVEFGGAELLTGMVNGVSTSLHCEFHARQVKNYSLLRKMIRLGVGLAEECYTHEAPAEDIVERAEKNIYSLVAESEQYDLTRVTDDLMEHLEQMEIIKGKKQKTIGLETGFDSLDRITAGLQRGNMITLAARPGMGKTSLAMDIIRHAILKGIPTAFFSLEMTRSEIINRMISGISSIPLFQVKNGFFPDSEWHRIQSASEKIHEAPFYLSCASANNSVNSIRSCSRRLASQMLRDKKKLGLIVVDYMQLLSSHVRRFENRQAEVSDISRAIKAMAVDLDVPVLALSQLNRQLEEHGRSGRPRLSDLRESGAIEQDSDMVMFIYRPDFNKEKSTEEEKAKTKLIIAKHRNGACGEIDLFFRGKTTSFIEMTTKEDGSPEDFPRSSAD